MLKNKKTYYLLILDKSGSMGSVILPTVQGFNEQVQMIKKLQQKFPEQEIRVSLTTFNDFIDEDMSMVRPEALKELRSRKQSRLFNGDGISYSPNGMTALYDAIGSSVKRLKKEIKKEIKEDKATAVVVIITDGHENASRKYSYEKIQKMIAKLEKSENWTFSYLGSTPDAVNIARNLNIREHNSMYFEQDNIQASYTNINDGLENYMSRKRQGMKSKKFLKGGE